MPMGTGVVANRIPKKKKYYFEKFCLYGLENIFFLISQHSGEFSM